MNEDTQLIQEDIPTVLTYLFATYGVVPTEEVKEQENEIYSMTFHPADPLIMLYGPIEKLQKLAGAAWISYTLEQILNIGITVIKNTRDIERALMDWLAQLLQDKTWPNFKTHFTAAQKVSKKRRGPTMLQEGYHHAKMVASELQDSLTTHNDKVVAMIQQVIQRQALPLDIPADETGPPSHQANATTLDSI